MGIGKGSGKDQTTNVVAGSCCAICCGVCFLVIGLPMLITGIVLVQINKGQYDSEFDEAFNENFPDDSTVSEEEIKDVMYKIGIALIVISVLCVVIGVVMVICLCTGCCGSKKPTGGQVLSPMTQTTIVQHNQQYPAQPNQAYVQQQPYNPPPAQNMQHAPPPAYNPDMTPAYGEKVAY